MSPILGVISIVIISEVVVSVVVVSWLEPILFCLNVMDQRFHLAKNKSSKFTFLKHAYFT